MIFQILVSRIFEKFRAIPSFLLGLFIAAIGFLLLAYSKIASPSWVFLGIFLFAVGEMISSPRIQEYITWIAPKEKAGLYMGSNFLPIGLGGVLGSFIYTPLYGYFRDMNHPEYVWLILSVHLIVGILAMFIFTKSQGEFKELEE